MSTHVVTNAEQTDELVSRRDVAERWKTSVATVKRREKEGLLTPVKFNQRLLRYRLGQVQSLENAALGGVA
jgi:hypothetical protein